uniref:Uncharacterized protein n=1 Tax=Sparus aurata TaxID=8175 RepID=A0A671TZP6_SPAAU
SKGMYFCFMLSKLALKSYNLICFSDFIYCSLCCHLKICPRFDYVHHSETGSSIGCGEPIYSTTSTKMSHQVLDILKVAVEPNDQLRIKFFLRGSTRPNTPQ